MIKLVDNPDEIKKLVIHSPYLGGQIMKEAETFKGDYDLMDVWAEIGDNGKVLSAVSMNDETVTVISEKGPGIEMIFFIKKIADSVSHRKITCDEKSIEKVKIVFEGKIKEHDVMKCSKKTDIPEIHFDIKEDCDPKDIISIVDSDRPSHSKDEDEMFLLRTVRGRKNGQVKSFTAFDGEKPVATASVNGITNSGGCITTVITLPDYRNKGIATCLTSMCCKFLRDKKLDSYLIPCDDSVRHLYEKLGFKNYCKIYDILIER